MKKIEDFIHLYLGCEVLVPKEQYWVDVAAKRKFPNDGIEKLQSVSFAGDGTITVSWPEGGFMILYPDDCKLILRPLSDMKLKEVRELFDVSIAPKFAAEIVEEISKSLEGLHKRIAWYGSFDTIPKMLKMNFDLYGLIEAGLAIDKTTLK